jgi:hypothetical protein
MAPPGDEGTAEIPGELVAAAANPRWKTEIAL